MEIKIKKIVPEACIPKNATPLDTGYDLVTIDDGQIVGEVISGKDGFWKRIDYIQYRTGIQIAPREDKKYFKGSMFFDTSLTDYFYTLILPRSSVSKYNLVLANSVATIDNGYRGELLLRFKYIWQPEDYSIEQIGEDYNPATRIGRSSYSFLLGSPNLSKIYKKGDKVGQLAAFKLFSIGFNEVADLDETARGEGGFGSTGT